MPTDGPIGTIVAGYRIERELGTGAAGVVYLARDEHLDRAVALKLLPPELTRDERFRARFLRESRVAAVLDHPAIVPVYAAGEADGRLYLAMRYVDGGDLGAAVEAEGRLELHRVLKLLRQVAAALDAAHAEGLIHRDVKPGNILVSGDRAYLADFGLAKHAATVNSLSRESAFSGTIDYVAPEQIQGGAVDGRADQYALGCVLFQCLSGRAPFRRDSDVAVVFAHLKDAPPSIAALRPDLPAGLDAVVGRALAKDPGDRYGSCTDLLGDAARAAGGGEVTTAPARAAQLRTFLIADVRGYTRYTQQHGDEAGAELAQAFAALAERVVAAHEGRLIELRGDEALAVFESPRRALAAAVALQAEADLPRGIGVGLDAGEAVPVGTGYRGGALNMAARLCSLAEGGQILASETVTQLARAMPGIRYLHGRVERLKGIDHPVRVVEVAGGDAGDGLAARARRRLRGRRRAPLAAAAGLVAVIAAAVMLGTGGGRPSGPPLAKAGTIGVFDTRTGAFRGAVRGETAFAVQVAAGRSWWLTDGTADEVDPVTRRVRRRVPIGHWIQSAAGGGYIWITSTDRPVVIRLDPRYGSTDTFPLPKAGVDDPGGQGIAFGGGLVWVGQGGQRLVGLDPTTLRVKRRVDAQGMTDIVRYGDGALWVAASGTGAFARIDPTSGSLTWQTRLHPWIPDILPAAGSLWVTVDSDASVYRYDERTGRLLGQIPAATGSANLTYGDGAVWVSDWRAGAVTRVDPLSGAHRSFRVGPAAVPVAVVGRRMLVGVGPAAPPPSEFVTGNVAHVLLREDWIDSIDPATSWADRMWELEYALEVKLYNYRDPAPGILGSELVPEVAAALPRVSADGLTYTIPIPPGRSRFSPPSNAPVTAQTARYSIERALSPRLGFRPAYDAQFLTGLNGEVDYANGNADHIRGLQVRGNDLVMRFGAPVPDLAERLAMPFFSMVPIGTPATGIDYQNHPIPSAGPYYLIYHNAGWEAIVKRNPNYRGARPHRLDGIVYDVGIDTGPAAQMVERNRADYASEAYPDFGVFAPGLPLSSEFGGRRRTSRAAYVPIPEPGNRFLAFNDTHGIFRDVRARRAVNLAIDRPALAAVDGAVPTDHYFPITMPGVRRSAHVYPVTSPSATDLARARALLRHRHLRAVLYTCTKDDCAARASLLRTELGRVGIRLVVRRFDNVYGAGSGFDILEGGWFTDEFDPTNVLDGAIFSDPTIFTDRAWQRRAAAVAKLRPPDRFAAFGRFELELMRASVPWASFEQASRPAFLSARLGCVHADPVYAGLDLAALCIRHT